jgi:hypothetical protein
MEPNSIRPEQAHVSVSYVTTPLRRLEGITYWVIDNPEEIRDFINTEVRREWEQDIKEMARDPASGIWLETLPSRKWRLSIVRTADVKLNEFALNYVDAKSGYNFAERLAERGKELRKGIELWGRVIWPIIVRGEDMEVLDGYCRYTTLRELGVSRLYAYVGSLR